MIVVDRIYTKRVLFLELRVRVHIFLFTWKFHQQTFNNRSDFSMKFHTIPWIAGVKKMEDFEIAMNQKWGKSILKT